MLYYDETPLLYASPPMHDESLVGYLLRLSHEHGLKTPRPLLQLIHDKPQSIPSVRQLERIAALTGTDPADVGKLFGFQRRSPDGEPLWTIGNEVLTKPYFVSSNLLGYCPQCLAEKAYLRAHWELTFYRACPRHRAALRDTCHVCGRTVRWRRPGPSTCVCGADLSRAPTLTPAPFVEFVASLIERRLLVDPQLQAPAVLHPQMSARLGRLSLDGLFKTIWFLGSILPVGARIHARRGAPNKAQNVLSMLQSAEQVLRGWPDSLFQCLRQVSRSNLGPSGRAVLAQIYGPVHRYLSQDMTSAELRFLTLAYERHVRLAWAQVGRSCPRTLSTQLELFLEDVDVTTEQENSQA